ncbi:MAG: hypothetical protein ABII00_18580 [Elusimicrobiota bacterium]
MNGTDKEDDRIAPMGPEELFRKRRGRLIFFAIGALMLAGVALRTSDSGAPEEAATVRLRTSEVIEIRRDVSDSTSLIVNPAPPPGIPRFDDRKAAPAVSVSSGSLPAIEASGKLSEIGLGRLDVAWMLHPYARTAIDFLESINEKKSWNPMYRFRPSAMLGAWEEMLRRHFKTVTRIERIDEVAPGRFHLVLNLDLHLKFGAVSGSTTRVTAQAHMLRPDGINVEHIKVINEKTVPYPATNNMLFEAFLEALDGMEAALKSSPQLAAFAQALQPV